MKSSSSEDSKNSSDSEEEIKIKENPKLIKFLDEEKVFPGWKKAAHRII